MRKFHLYLGILSAFLFLQTIGNSVFADNVDLQKAKQVAAYYMKVQSGAKSLDAADLTLVYQIANAELNIPALYFFNTNNGGYIIIAGSDCMDPVVGYSAEGIFDPNHMPPAMQWFLKGYVSAIVSYQNTNAMPSAAVQNTWNELVYQKLAPTSPKTIYKTMTSIWNQDYPFNAACPTVNDTVCPTGCVATAMAQIIHYWKYPKVGRGYPSYDWNGQTLSANLAQTHYDYDLMPDTATNSWTQAQVNATAQLNYHCGIANRMGYSSQSSGAVTRTYTKNAFKMYFKYNSSLIKEIDRNDSPFVNNTGTPNAADTLWLDTCAQEIKAKRPILYCGCDNSSSGLDARHAFVLERYNSSNKRCWFNWGWGGYCDGWFNVITSSLTPDGYRFDSENYAIIGITPPADSLVGIAEVESNTKVYPAYPNPTHTWLTIPYTFGSAEATELQVYSVDGRLMESRTIYASDNRTTINVANYPQGLYIYRIDGVTRKFIVQ